MREPRRARGSRRCPPRVRLCPTAAPTPAPAPQGESSNSPAGDGERETYCCFFSAAHVPQLAKCRLMKFQANAAACHPVPRLQASATDARPHRATRRRQRCERPSQEKSRSPLSWRPEEKRPEGHPLLASGGHGAPRLRGTDRLSPPHGDRPGLGGSAPGRVSRLLPAAIRPSWRGYHPLWLRSGGEAAGETQVCGGAAVVRSGAGSGGGRAGPCREP